MDLQKRILWYVLTSDLKFTLTYQQRVLENTNFNFLSRYAFLLVLFTAIMDKRFGKVKEILHVLNDVRKIA